jgi:hypothetical protein
VICPSLRAGTEFTGSDVTGGAGIPVSERGLVPRENTAFLAAPEGFSRSGGDGGV